MSLVTNCRSSATHLRNNTNTEMAEHSQRNSNTDTDSSENLCRRLAQGAELIDDQTNDGAELRALIGDPLFWLCYSIAVSLGVSPSSIYPLLMSILSALVGSKATILINKDTGHKVRYVLWNIILNWSGTGKSPIVDFMKSVVEYVDAKVKTLMLAKLDAILEARRTRPSTWSEDDDNADHQGADDNESDGEPDTHNTRGTGGRGAAGRTGGNAAAAANNAAARRAKATKAAATTRAKAMKKKDADEKVWLGRIRSHIESFTQLDTSVTMEAKHLAMLYAQHYLGVTTKV